MEFINLPGINCYHLCIITIAASRIRDYNNAFADLWSETEFDYSSEYKLYVSKRLFFNFETLGLHLQTLAFSSKSEAEKYVSSLPSGTIIILKMDAFEIPWSPVYQLLHEEHYFIANKQDSGQFVCLDPTYDKQGMLLDLQNSVVNVRKFIAVSKTEETACPISPGKEAEAILHNHPELQRNLSEAIQECHEKPEKAILLGKYADAMISNRRLYRQYLYETSRELMEAQGYFDKEFFWQWSAVKHGLYKAAMVKKNEVVLQEVSGQLQALIWKEMDMAQKILGV